MSQTSGSFMNVRIAAWFTSIRVDVQVVHYYVLLAGAPGPHVTGQAVF